jgi:molybdopterin biosynthesis enzyme MoaB
MITVGIVTVSDRSSRGEREDLSGPEIRRWAGEKRYDVVKEEIVPDDIDAIKKVLVDMSDRGILPDPFHRGTGFGPRITHPRRPVQ